MESVVQATPRQDRPAPGHAAAPARVWRSLRQVVVAALVFAALGWLIWTGAQSMNYSWQWQRIAPFFYRRVGEAIVWGPLVRGTIVTLQLAALSTVLAILIGTLTAAARLSRSIAARALATLYLEAMRNTPLLVQLFLFYFVVAPIFGIDRFWAAVLCLAFFEGTFAAEIIRGGIIAVDRGQLEAARTVGLNRRDTYRYVVMPQALPLILPPLTGLVISLVKNSAIVSVIAVSELTTQGLNLISDTFMAFEIWFVVAGIYLALTISLSVGVSVLESRLNRGPR